MKFWLPLTLLLLLGSLLINLLVGRWTLQYYRQLNADRLDPLGIRMYASEPLLPPKTRNRPRILFFGDSRAYAWPAPVELSHVEFINRGIGGQTTAQILARFDEHVTSLQPDLVILQAGINDLKTIPLFPTRRDEIIAGCKENLAAIVQRVTEQDATVILTTIFPPARPSLVRRPFWSDAVGEAVIDVNEYLKTLAAEQVILLDSAALLASDNGLIRPEYSYDLLHINQTGYVELNQALVRQLD